MSLQELESARERCRQELSALPGWALGSLVETEREQRGKRKPFRYLSRSSQARNRIPYISEVRMGCWNGTKNANHVAPSIFPLGNTPVTL
jgi:hypothetical protein